MKIINTKAIAVLAVITFISAFSVNISLAAAGNPIEIQIKLEKELIVKGDNGKPHIEWVEATGAVKRGDVVKKTLTYKNNGTATYVNAAPYANIPVGMVYMDGSASGKNVEIQFSTDGKSFAPPEALTTQLANVAAKKALREEYRAVKWLVKSPIKPGEVGVLSFKARVL